MKQCGEAGRYVHWGATTQDIMDTAVVLQVREGLDIVEADIAELRGILARSGEEAIATRRWPGRTHLQQALPDHLRLQGRDLARHVRPPRRTAAATQPRVLVGEFAGAAGTLASLGDKGFEVQKAMMRGTGPRACRSSTWHVARDGFAETVNLLGLITGSLGKIALRHHADGVDRVRRGLRAVRQGARRVAARCRRSATRSRAS